jgi:hypothetical protein
VSYLALPFFQALQLEFLHRSSVQVKQLAYGRLTGSSINRERVQSCRLWIPDLYLTLR